VIDAVDVDDLAAIGVTNQRETTVVWDRETGEPIHNAIVWQDTRTDELVRALAGDQGLDRLREQVGLPLSTYFSGPKVTWILEHVDGARERADRGELAFGTIDTWLLWNLTGLHVTDVSNASRTLLMDLETLDWHEPSLDLMGIPRP
jgi:glycerol kinase